MQPPQNPYGQPNYGQPGSAPYGTPGHGQPRGTVSLDVIGEAWNLVKGSIGQWIIAFLIVGAVGFVFSIVMQILLRVFTPANGQAPGGGFWFMFMILELIFVVLMVAVSAGLIKMAITQTRTGTASLSEITDVGDIIGPVIVASILVGIIVNIGSLLCIVPGIIAWLGLSMVQPLVIDQKMGAVDAMKRSWEVMKPHLGMAFVLYLVLYLINIAGMMLCGVGVLVTAPITMVAIALVYRDLFGTGGTAAPTGYTPPPIANPNF